MTIDEARAEVAKLKSDLVERLDQFQKETGLRLRTGINIVYLETTRLGNKDAEYLVDRVEFDVQL